MEGPVLVECVVDPRAAAAAQALTALARAGASSEDRDAIGGSWRFSTGRRRTSSRAEICEAPSHSRSQRRGHPPALPEDPAPRRQRERLRDHRVLALFGYGSVYATAHATSRILATRPIGLEAFHEHQRGAGASACSHRLREARRRGQHGMTRHRSARSGARLARPRVVDRREPHRRARGSPPAVRGRRRRSGEARAVPSRARPHDRAARLHAHRLRSLRRRVRPHARHLRSEDGRGRPATRSRRASSTRSWPSRASSDSRSSSAASRRSARSRGCLHARSAHGSRSVNVRRRSRRGAASCSGRTRSTTLLAARCTRRGGGARLRRRSAERSALVRAPALRLRRARRRAAPPRGGRPRAETLVVTAGFSCREQICHGTERPALHLAEILRMALQAGAPEGVVRKRSPVRALVTIGLAVAAVVAVRRLSWRRAGGTAW